MTAILLTVLALAVVADLLATLRTVRHDKPVAVPNSHLDWSGAGLPSHPYSSSA